MRQLLLLISCLSINAPLCAQHLDSLRNLLNENQDDSARAYTLDELSYQWFYENLDSSLHYGVLAYQQFSRLSDPKGLSQSATSVAVAYHYLNHWDSAEYYYMRALTIREENKLDRVASSLNNLGVMFMDQEKYDEATRYYIKSMEVRMQANDTVGAAITQSNLGLIFKKQGNYSKALSYYTEAIKTLEKNNKMRYLEVALLNLGAIYNTLEKYDTAFLYNNKLRLLTIQNNSQRNLAKSYVNLSNSYEGLNELDSSLFYAEKALTFFEKQSDTLNMANATLSLAQAHFKVSNYKEAITFGKRLETLNTSLDNKEMAIENQLLIASAFANLNDFKAAFSHLEKSFHLKDSFLTTSLNQTISDLSLKYETEQKEREIADLLITNQKTIIAQQKAANERNILFFITGGLVLGAILLFFLLKTKSKANALITQSLHDKETLLKEIHHRVKNNLQVISSLLSLQSRFIEDKEAKALVNEGQNRVKSMALIHQKLYQKDNLTGVEALEYIQNLSATLQSAYSINADKVNVNYQVDSLNLDVDTMIPVGLILNELISNAYKHAFPTGEGALDITLQQIEQKLVLQVQDNGVGAMTSIEKSKSFGMRMIESLARKLEADVSFDFNQGTIVKLSISNYKLV